MNNLYIFKGCGAKNLLQNFQIKVGDCGDWTTSEEVARNWHDGYRWSSNSDSIQNLSCFSIL